MHARYRVELTRANHHVPGLVGDYEDIQAARDAGNAAKASDPSARVTIQRGWNTPLDKQPEHQRNEYGHHFLVASNIIEEID